jgi:hypothetical protein
LVRGPIIVGAGPSVLAVAATLSQHAVPFTMLERSDGIAYLWTNRTYDRLRLHLDGVESSASTDCSGSTESGPSSESDEMEAGTISISSSTESSPTSESDVMKSSANAGVESAEDASMESGATSISYCGEGERPAACGGG